MQDISRAALVKALMLVLSHPDLTRAEKRSVSALLEDQIAALVSGGERNDTQIAQKAVSRAIFSYRTSRGLRSVAALARQAVFRRKQPQAS